MKIKEIIETASAGATCAGSIATNMAPSKTPPKGQFFGGDPTSSIYSNIKNNRRKRKNVTPRV